LVTVLRRFLSSPDSQVERFTMLNDPNVARAFAEMVSNPEASHSVERLSRSSGLSRSVFMARFTRAYGDSPMAILRELRMRQAASLLEKNLLSIERVARSVGYESRSSFFRAFREAFGTDPSDYAKQLSERQGQPSISNEKSSQEGVE
jgi:AraC family transcriptional activator of mtrCDE